MDLFKNLRLHELISWSVQEGFSNCPFDGWIKALGCAIPLQLSLDSQEEHSTQKTLNQMIQETSDKIIVEKLLQQGSESSSNGPLNIIRDLCNGSVTNIEQDQEARSTLLELANWAAENWKEISE